MKKNTGIPVLAGVLTAGALLPLFVKPPRRLVASEQGRDWMSVLCDDTPVSHLAIPGTHDSASEKILCASIARCQHLTVTQQMEAGFRFLDLRCRVKGDRLVMVHGKTPCLSAQGGKVSDYTLDQLLEEIYAFLKAHPGETLLVSIKNDGKEDDRLFADILYRRYLSLSSRFWYLENRVPLLGEVRGRAVLLRRFYSDSADLDDSCCGLNAGPQLWGNMRGRKTLGYKKFPMEHIKDGGNAGKICLQDCYSQGVHDKWYGCVKPLLDRGRHKGETVLNFVSCTGRLFPVAAALELNRRFLSSRVSELDRGGVVIFDFADAQLAQKVYACNSRRVDSAKKAPICREAYSPDRDNGASRYLSGYDNLLYHIFDKKILG